MIHTQNLFAVDNYINTSFAFSHIANAVLSRPYLDSLVILMYLSKIT
jgi:hypothetical protein